VTILLTVITNQFPFSTKLTSCWRVQQKWIVAKQKKIALSVVQLITFDRSRPRPRSRSKG